MSSSHIDSMTTQTRTSPDDSATTIILNAKINRHRVVMPDCEFYPRCVVLWSVLMEKLKDTVYTPEIYGKHKTIPNLVDCNTRKETHASFDDHVASDARLSPDNIFATDARVSPDDNVSRNSNLGYITMPKDKLYYDVLLSYLFKN